MRGGDGIIPGTQIVCGCGSRGFHPDKKKKKKEKKTGDGDSHRQGAPFTHADPSRYPVLLVPNGAADTKYAAAERTRHVDRKRVRPYRHGRGRVQVTLLHRHNRDDEYTPYRPYPYGGVSSGLWFLQNVDSRWGDVGRWLVVMLGGGWWCWWW